MNKMSLLETFYQHVLRINLEGRARVSTRAYNLSVISHLKDIAVVELRQPSPTRNPK